MSEPLVSVIIPVYNTEKYLRQCLDSVINQTLKDIEIICVDDGSTDSSLEILKEYQEKDNRIIIIRQQNQYTGIARNNGLKLATGKYISILDSDDFFELNMLEDMYNQAEKDNSDIVCCGWKRYDNEQGKVVAERKMIERFAVKSPLKPETLNPYLFTFSQVNTWSKLIRRKIFTDNNIQFENTICSNDLTAICLALCCAKKISINRGLYITYRANQKTNVSAIRDKDYIGFTCELNSLESLKKNLERLKIFKKFEKSFYGKCHAFFNRNNTQEHKDIAIKKISKDLYDRYYK